MDSHRAIVGADEDRDHHAITDLRNTLSYLMPHLDKFWSRPLNDYARAVYDVEHRRTGCPPRDEAISFLLKCVERVALGSGADEQEARQAADQLVASPIIQSGPHCHLLIEPDAFYTHLFSLIGLGAHRLRWHICYNASTVKFIERPKKGPGWLHFEGEAINVFGLTRSRMDSYSICGFNGPYRFMLSGRKNREPANAAAARLKAFLPNTEFSSAANAIKAGNQAIWKKAFPPQVRLLQLDDIDVADLVAEHLEEPGSWLSTRFIGNGLFAHTILEEIDNLNAGPWARWIRRTTDLFWGLAEGKIFPLRLGRNVLSGGYGSRFAVRFSPVDIAVALRQRKIVPSLLTTFLVTSILPGVRVLGGCRQTIYYPLMRYIVANALEKLSERDLLNALSGDVCPGVWGHRVLKPSEAYPLLEIEKNGSVLDLLTNYGEQSLAQACGDLVSFTSDPIWAELSMCIANGTIHAQSPEWRWAQLS
ncbi:hypothetical protein [Paramesorhizobium deserti]|uniref:hypothetical protein n=1 Tax=Paramesorhizobium deserti TaxID=1494590 RepID=UPI000AE77423|nr:hypothetical protein [Paramesorhizobium deserti]